MMYHILVAIFNYQINTSQKIFIQHFPLDLKSLDCDIDHLLIFLSNKTTNNLIQSTMSAWDTDNWGGGGGGASPAWDAGYPKNTKDYDAMAKQVEEDKETGQHVDHGFGQSFGDDGPAADNDGGNGGDDRTCYNCNQPGYVHLADVLNSADQSF